MDSERSRRSIASQYFMDEDSTTADMAEGINTSDRVIDLINQTHLLTKDSQKIANLKHVQELIVHKDPTLLDNFLDEVLQFQHDKSADVRKFVVGFIEEACKKDNDMLCSVIPHLNMMLSDSAQHVAVIKKVILCSMQLYKIALKWLVNARTFGEEMEAVWDQIQEIKRKVFIMLDSENDGIRTHSTKYMESLILVESARVAGSEIPKKPEADISLDQIPEEHGLLKREELEKDGLHAFELLLDLLASPSITSVNLMACMGSLTTIAKQRPQFMARVIQAFETLHVNLPPTLAKSQVSSVRKHLKMQLLNLLKHPSSVSLHSNITTLLTDLGASEAEISKHMPKVRESFKRPRPADDEGSSNSKKPKTTTVKTIQQVMDEDEMGRETPLHPTLLPSMPSTSKATIQAPAKISVVDLLAEELTPLLQNVENVANLVLISMVTLPETMPPQFQASYTPIAAAGTDSQISHLARMMSSQFATAGIKPQNMEMLEQEEEAADKENKSAVTQKPTGIPVLGEAEEDTGRKKSGLSFQAPVGVPKPRARMKQFKLSDVTVPLEQMVANKLVSGAVSRIITSEKMSQQGGASQARIKILVGLVSQFSEMSQQGGASQARIKILVGLVSQFSGDLFPMLKDHVLEDLRSRSELAFAWLYQEYSSYQGYMPRYLDQEVSMNRYDKLLCAMLMALLDRPDQRDGLFTRLVMEAPVITERAVKVIRKFCEDETHFFTGMHALRELILKRPADIQRYLQELLELTFHERTEVRSQATQYVKRLYERQDLKETIEEFASKCLHYLLSDVPNPSLVSRTSEGGEGGSDWTEASIKLCLHLYLALLPSNHKLIHELATVYVATSALIKRTVLRVLEAPVRGMGMSSPELLLLVENCPKGAETLVTRMLHILTDKAPPSQDLVKRVRDLYLKRVSDVRFLIPVLIGLEKKEVIAALPKLIKLNPIVVKEVFHRLLMSHQGDNSAGQSPLTPAELLIALHNIDTSKCDIKSIIKATSLCFNEKAIYTQEVLAVVMQQLMEQGTVPTLLMRTVIQSLGMYPRLSGFVMNILQRLIVKQVWNLPKVWEGFVKCCERTKPQSFQVLLQLPAEQLKNVFEMSPDMRAPMLAHVQTFTPHQQAHIPPPIMTVLETDPLAEKKKMEEEERKKREEELRIKMEAEEKQKEEERLLQEKLAEERRKQEQLKKEAAEKAAKEKAEKLKAQREAEEKKRKEAEEKLARERQEKMRAEQEASLKAAREAGERVAREARERREKREAAREAGIKAAMEAKEKKEKMEAEERARRQEEQQKAALARQEEMEKKKQEEEQKKQEEIKRKEEEALKREEEERRQQEEQKSRQEEENKKREEETLKQEEEKIRQEVEAEKKRQEELEAERRIKEQIQEDQEMQEMVTVKQEPDELKEFEAAAHQEMPLKIKQEKPDQEAQEATVDTEFKIKKEVEDYPEQEAVENPFQETVEDESQSSNPVASAELESEDTGDGSVQSEMPSPAGRGRGRGRGGRGRGRGAKKTATPSPSGTRKSTRKKN
ncbi:symplekin-like [Acanthaster planci]|uniref:Symplekin-like n=1 Tax=Acanthaster planci TaxID=133434 RepID=A0A8B7Y1S5_ACAPL|nr:symplekin-like [Acanthaster planci]